MLTISELPLDELKLNPRNARRSTPARERQLLTTMKAERLMLEVRPVIVNKADRTVIAGNMRVQAARSDGWKTIPGALVEVDEVTAVVWQLLDNRGFGEDDPDMTAELLAELEAAGANLDLTGFARADTDALMRRLVYRDKNADELPVLPAGDPETKPGDIIDLDPHRLMCGSAIEPDHVDALFDGAEPTLIATDPPYGIQLDNSWRERAGLNRGPRGTRESSKRTSAHATTTLASDTRAEWSEAYALVPSARMMYIWHASVNACAVQSGLEAIGFDVRQQLVWDKGAFALSRQHYHWAHEPCFYATRRGVKVPWYGPRNQSTVWKAASPKMMSSGNGAAEDAKVDHPSQKPVTLFRPPIENHLQPGEAVYDPFGGSGTALIAAELTGRRAYLMELDPRCCDVIRRRYEAFARGRR